MIIKWADKFVKFQLKLGTISQEDIKVYQYGYMLMIEVAINLSISLMLGIILGSLKEVIFFLCVFIPLRSFSGGYHADKAWKCIILSNVIIASIVFVSKLGIGKLCFNKYVICGILFVLPVIVLSPVENQNKKIDVKEKRIFKICTALIVISELVLGVFMEFNGMMPYCDIVLFSLGVQLTSMLIAKCKR